MSAASRASRASGPAWSRVYESGMMPRSEVRPIVGFRPVSPCWLEGFVIDPPVCVPMLEHAMRPAVAVAEPDDEPPGS
jgi:hypothetical protein